MNLGLSEDQEMIRTTAREFLERECPASFVLEMEEDELGFSRDMWKTMAELGWTGLALPEQHGGSGLGFADLCVLLEEHGRSMLPGPFFPTVVLCGRALAKFGSDEQKSQYLPGITAGEKVWTYAQTEPNGGWGPEDVELQAEENGAGFSLNGTKLFVPFAHAADYMLVSARTGGMGDDGITLFIVDAASDGIECEQMETVAADRLCEVRFNDVRVPPANVAGEVDRGHKIVCAINALGAAAKCAEMVGGAQRVLEMTVLYAQERVQFGKPIGSFQAVQHHCSNMVTDVDGARLIAYEAIWRLGEDLDSGLDVSVAKSWVSDAYRRVLFLAHQVHGAIGFTKEHDLQLYTRRAKSCELAFGDSHYHRKQVAQQLGL